MGVAGISAVSLEAATATAAGATTGPHAATKMTRAENIERQRRNDEQPMVQPLSSFKGTYGMGPSVGAQTMP